MGVELIYTLLSKGVLFWEFSTLESGCTMSAWNGRSVNRADTHNDQLYCWHLLGFFLAEDFMYRLLGNIQIIHYENGWGRISSVISVNL